MINISKKSVLITPEDRFQVYMRNQIFGQADMVRAAVYGGDRTENFEIKKSSQIYQAEIVDVDNDNMINYVDGDTYIYWESGPYTIQYETDQIKKDQIVFVIEKPVSNGNEESKYFFPCLYVFAFDRKEDLKPKSIISLFFTGAIEPVFRETDMQKFSISYKVIPDSTANEEYYNMNSYSFNNLEEEIGDIDSDIIIVPFDNDKWTKVYYNKITKLVIFSDDAKFENDVFYLEKEENLDQLVKEYYSEDINLLYGDENYIGTYTYLPDTGDFDIIRQRGNFASKFEQSKITNFDVVYPNGKIHFATLDTDFASGFSMEFKQSDQVVLFSDVFIFKTMCQSKNTTYEATISGFGTDKPFISNYNGFFANEETTIVRDPFYKPIKITRSV